MCWSIEFTTLFIFIYVISIIILFMTKPKKYVCFILFALFYTVMEIFQLLQWLYGDVLHTVQESTQCSLLNRYFTYFAFVLIWLQPLLFSFIGYIAYRSKEFKKLSIITSCLFLFVFLTLVYTTEHNINNGYPLVDSNIGNSTCTFVGQNNHLQWMFKGFFIDYQANNLMYFVLCIIAMSFYNWDLFGVTLSWFLTLVITLSFFNVSKSEIPSFWCFLSVFSNVVNLIYALIYNRRDDDEFFSAEIV